MCGEKKKKAFHIDRRDIGCVFFCSSFGIRMKLGYIELIANMLKNYITHNSCIVHAISMSLLVVCFCGHLMPKLSVYLVSTCYVPLNGFSIQRNYICGLNISWCYWADESLVRENEKQKHTTDVATAKRSRKKKTSSAFRLAVSFCALHREHASQSFGRACMWVCCHNG